MLHVPVFATNDAHERFCRAVIERAGMVTHAQTKAGLERRALEAIQRLGFREAETLAVNGDHHKADSFRKSIRANMLHRDKIRLWGPVRPRESSVVRNVSIDLSDLVLHFIFRALRNSCVRSCTRSMAASACNGRNSASSSACEFWGRSGSHGSSL